MIRVAEGQYRIGETQTLVFLRVGYAISTIIVMTCVVINSNSFIISVFVLVSYVLLSFTSIFNYGLVSEINLMVGWINY